MRECVESNDVRTVDMACLWISSLEHGNASVEKYPMPIIQRLLALSSTEGQVDNGDDDITRNGAIAGMNEYLESSSGEDKVNVICLVLRDALMKLLNEGCSAAFRPLLCTLAKQIRLIS